MEVQRHKTEYPRVVRQYQVMSVTGKRPNISKFWFFVFTKKTLTIYTCCLSNKMGRGVGGGSGW